LHHHRHIPGKINKFALVFSNTGTTNKITQSHKGVNKDAKSSSDLFCGVPLVLKKGPAKAGPSDCWQALHEVRSWFFYLAGGISLNYRATEG